MMQNRPVFLSGKVVMEDGTPPPDAVIIERVCGGERTSRRRTRTARAGLTSNLDKTKA